MMERPLTDENIRAMFEGANDFIARELRCGPWTLYSYAIDGLTAGGDTSDYVIKPITEHLAANTMAALYERALHGMVYNSVADCGAEAGQRLLRHPVPGRWSNRF